MNDIYKLKNKRFLGLGEIAVILLLLVSAILILIQVLGSRPQVQLGLSILIILATLLYAFALSHRVSKALGQKAENKAGELRESENTLVKLRKAVETSGEVIFITDREGIITYINPAFTKLYGYSAKEVIDQVTPRILKSGILSQQDYELFWKILLSKQVVKTEMTNRCQDGRLVTIEASANPILDEKETIIGFLAIQQDITERKQAEVQIKRHNQELAVLNAIATTVNQSLDVEQILNDALDELLQLDMFGGMAKGMLFRLNEREGTLSLMAHRGAPMDHPCLVNPPQLGECLCGLVAQQGEMIFCKCGGHDLRHTRRWETMSEHQDICLPLKVRGKVLGVMNMRLPADREIADTDIKLLTAVSDQISIAIENAQLFEAVSQQRSQLQELTAQLTEAEENERRQLARELHDQVGQNLTALGINLNIIRSSLPEQKQGDVASRINESLALVEQTTERIRDVMSDLRPPMLDDYGLLAALRWYGERFSLRTGLSVTVPSDGNSPLKLPPPVANVLFRIAQEALTNISKHARAQNATITVTTETVTAVENIVRLIIADDGVGFDSVRLRSQPSSQGWGLRIMAERASSVNGRFQIKSQPAKGTQIIVEITL
ncbi:hypothetical protein MNBD_CHLOROFLEXI01-1465 [hydrothermal vent metagenome]|uniref:Uncharacterized protein n=1 Tax=hydrothermal vent metagenome TaxID=652676 RepID=A0A3B0VQX5_9ZZZZ